MRLIPKMIKLKSGGTYRIEYIDNRTKSVGIIKKVNGKRRSVEVNYGDYIVIDNIKL